MLNPIDAYSDAGYRCALARNQRDEARAIHFSDWFRRAKALETPEDAKEARRAFDKAYTTERGYR